MGVAQARKPYTTVRCSATLPEGHACDTAIWRAHDSRIEISHGLRAGRRFTFELPLAAAQETSFPCVRCGARWWPVTTTLARRIVFAEQIAAALTARRAPDEIDQLLDHACKHVGEAA